MIGVVAESIIWMCIESDLKEEFIPLDNSPFNLIPELTSEGFFSFWIVRIVDAIHFITLLC